MSINRKLEELDEGIDPAFDIHETHLTREGIVLQIKLKNRIDPNIKDGFQKHTRRKLLSMQIKPEFPYALGELIFNAPQVRPFLILPSEVLTTFKYFSISTSNISLI